MFGTNFSVGNVYSGEQCIDISPKFQYGKSLPGVAFVHGAGSNADYCLSDLGKQSSLTQKVGSIYPGISGDYGGPQTWGNSTAITRLGVYLTRLANRPEASDDYALVSASMGGITSINYAAAATRKPKAIVSVIPVINIEDIRANNRYGYAANINSAYGGAYNDFTMGTDYNPYVMRAAEKLVGIPMLLFYGLTDDLCLPAFTEQFADADSTNRTLVPLASGHDFDSYNAVNQEMIVDFLIQHMGY